VIMNDKMKW